MAAGTPGEATAPADLAGGLTFGGRRSAQAMVGVVLEPVIGDGVQSLWRRPIRRARGGAGA